MFGDTLLWSGLMVAIIMIATWLVSLPLKNSGIVDSVWSLGFIAVAILAVVVTEHPSFRAWMVLGLTLVWGLRLSAHITIRNYGRGEDPRYAAWRAEQGSIWPLRSLFTVFLLQGALLWLISFPLQVAIGQVGATRLTVWDGLGLLLWMVGFLIEVVADAQLAAFRRRRTESGAVLSTGLRRYSRHPHYFGEALLWWGFFFFAVSVPGGWRTVFAPILITVLVRWVSGVPMTDALLEKRPGYAEYAARTSPFIPLPPRRAPKA